MFLQALRALRPSRNTLTSAALAMLTASTLAAQQFPRPAYASQTSFFPAGTSVLPLPAPPATAINFRDSATGDFNGDGLIDVVAITAGVRNPSVAYGTSIPDPNFPLTTAAGPGIGAPIAVPLPGGAGAVAVGADPVDLRVGRFNADAFDDVAILYNNGFPGTAVGLALGGPSGLIGATAVGTAVPGNGGINNTGRMVDFDADADGDSDIVFLNGGAVTISINQGAGTFAAPVSVGLGLGAGGISVALCAIDRDADGDLDVVVATNSGAGSALVVLDNAAGVFTVSATVPHSSGGSVHLLTAPSQGNADNLVVFGTVDGELFVPNAGSYFPSGTRLSIAGWNGFDADAVDLNLDGFADIILSGSAGGLIVHESGSALGFFAPFTLPVSPTAAGNVTVDFGSDLDGDGSNDLFGTAAGVGGVNPLLWGRRHATPVGAWSASAPRVIPGFDLFFGVLTAPPLTFGAPSWTATYFLPAGTIPGGTSVTVALISGAPMATPVFANTGAGLAMLVNSTCSTILDGSQAISVLTANCDGVTGAAWSVGALPTIPGIVGVQAAMQVAIYDPVNANYVLSNSVVTTWGY